MREPLRRLIQVAGEFPAVDKVWGRTRCLVSSEFYSAHLLDTNAGCYCSAHFHRERANRFICVSGRIAVVEWMPSGTVRTVLSADMTYDVPSLVLHQFQVLESGLVVEEYWPDRGGTVRDDDIVRLSTGGTLEKDETWQAVTERHSVS